MPTLVIGGNSGIGAEFAAMHRKNWPNTVSPTIRELDVANPISIYTFIQNRPQDFQRVVYCAGVNFPSMIGELSSGEIGTSLAINVAGFITLLDCLKRRSNIKRSIIAVASDAATIAMRGSIAYCASKAALAMAIRCAAREMAPLWRVNGVSPGIVANTPMTDMIDRVIPAMRGWTPEQARAYEESLIPAARRATKFEVAKTIQWLLDGPDYINGAIIPITGGK